MVSMEGGRVKANAISALGQIGMIPEHVVPAIKSALHDPDRDVRVAAARLLAREE
jgi:HEAT repeat protein